MLRDDFKWQSSDPISSQMASMLYYDFFQDALPKFGFRSIQDAFNQMNSEFEYLNELSEALEVLLDQISLNEKEMDDASPFALKLHARYSRDEILSAFSVHTLQRKSSSREGVVELKDSNLELLFVTLQKNEKHFSPTTRYYDYAISPTLFHWQTQNSARPDRGKGLGYIEQEKTGKKIILFVRENTFDVHGRTCGFINLGYVRYKSHTQSQPMNINWELLHPLPGFLWISVAKLAVG